MCYDLCWWVGGHFVSAKKVTYAGNVGPVVDTVDVVDVVDAVE